MRIISYSSAEIPYNESPAIILESNIQTIITMTFTQLCHQTHLRAANCGLFNEFLTLHDNDRGLCDYTRRMEKLRIRYNITVDKNNCLRESHPKKDFENVIFFKLHKDYNNVQGFQKS